MLPDDAGLVVVIVVVKTTGPQAPVRNGQDHADCCGHESRERKHLSIRSALAS